MCNVNGSTLRPSGAHDERHALRHQTADEADVARQPIELGDADGRLGRFAALRAAASCGRRSSASAPFPLSISVYSAAMSKPSALAKAATAARCLRARAAAALLRGADAVVSDEGAHGASFVPSLPTITCPQCGHQATEIMPTDTCRFFYNCVCCGERLKPEPGDCCVFCSYGTVQCPPIQSGAHCS